MFKRLSFIAMLFFLITDSNCDAAVTTKVMDYHDGETACKNGVAYNPIASKHAMKTFHAFLNETLPKKERKRR